MTRREFITLPRAQQPKLPVIGFLGSPSAPEWSPFVTAFQRGLKETGYVEGENVTIEYRWADGQYDRLPALAANLARRCGSIQRPAPWCNTSCHRTRTCRRYSSTIRRLR